MKIHKEILDQKSKMERAEREMKSSRKDATQNLNDQEFLSNFDVRIGRHNDESILNFSKITEGYGSKREGES